MSEVRNFGLWLCILFIGALTVGLTCITLHAGPVISVAAGGVWGFALTMCWPFRSGS